MEQAPHKGTYTVRPRTRPPISKHSRGRCDDAYFHLPLVGRSKDREAIFRVGGEACKRHSFVAASPHPKNFFAALEFFRPPLEGEVKVSLCLIFPEKSRSSPAPLAASAVPSQRRCMCKAPRSYFPARAPTLWKTCGPSSAVAPSSPRAISRTR